MEPEKEKSDVYSITGFFTANGKEKCFGGFLFARKDHPEQRENPLVLPFKGLLCDCYGLSDIEGGISPDNLKFSKSYRDRRSEEKSIKYSLKRNPSGIWVGQYLPEDEEMFPGHVIAKTHLDWEDVDLALPSDFYSSLMPEELVKEMLEGGGVLPHRRGKFA